MQTRMYGKDFFQVFEKLCMYLCMYVFIFIKINSNEIPHFALLLARISSRMQARMHVPS